MGLWMWWLSIRSLTEIMTYVFRFMLYYDSKYEGHWHDSTSSSFASMSPMKCLMINSWFDANWHRSRYSLKYWWNGFLISDSARSSTIFWWMGALRAAYSFSVYFPALKSRLSCPLLFETMAHSFLASRVLSLSCSRKILWRTCSPGSVPRDRPCAIWPLRSRSTVLSIFYGPWLWLCFHP